MEQIRRGSVRIARPVSPSVIDFQYTDLWSVGDRGTSEQPIRHLGEARCAASVKSFRLAMAQGIPTHFLEQVDAKTIRVKEFLVPGRTSLSGETVGRMLPLEWIWRTRVFGSLLKRIEEGALNPTDLGFAKDAVVTKGTPLPKMLLECTTKFEPTDRHLAGDDARRLAQLSKGEWHECWDIAQAAVAVTNAAYESAGFMCPDGKLELGQCFDGRICLVDVFATQDENRIIRIEDGELFSKDLIREYLWSTPWKQELAEARKRHPTDKSAWPPYPRLPPEILRLVSGRYAHVARKYAGIVITH